MKNKLIKIENSNNFLYVYWILTDFCNHACSYCPDSLHNAKFHNNPNFSSEDCINFARKLVEISINTNKRLYVMLSGGEPTLQEQLPEILKILKPYGIVCVITNGTRGISWWESLLEFPDKVVITLHPEYYNNAKIRIKQLYNFLANRAITWQFNLMCMPDKWDIVTEMINDIDEQYRSFIVPKFIQDQGGIYHTLPHNYSEEQLNFIKNYSSKIKKLEPEEMSIGYYSDNSSKHIAANPLMANNENRFEGWACSAGVSSIAINPAGEVWAGICSIKKLGTIKNFKLPDGYIICSRKSCTCPADVTLDKYMID